jgi:hypothetical protein
MTTTEVEIGESPESGTVGAGLLEESANMRFVPYVEGGQPGAVSSTQAAKKSHLLPVMIVAFGLMAAAAVALLVSKKPKETSTFQDLGAGISNASGLKGSLQVRWQGNTAQYELKFEPLGPLQAQGFSFIAANRPLPINVNVRILDATGFALCEKSVAFPFGSTGVGSKDVFQNFIGKDGKVSAVNAQGLLPCTEDQFRQASYWDFATNFPTTAEQQSLMHKSSAAQARLEAERRAAQLRRQRSQSTATYMGDNRVVDYDSSRGVLEAGLGRDFLVLRASDRAAASAWAANGTLFHYKCDQRSRCMLTRAGGGETISVMALQ